MKLLILLLLCGLSGCNMQNAANQAIDLGRVDESAPLSDIGGNVAYAAAPEDGITDPAYQPGAVLAECSTSFEGGSKARKNNIKIASDAINQHVVKPGEVFSFNDTVGPTKKEAGFLLARIFIKGRDAEGYGGGVCQVSSTLHKAAKDAGLEIVERHPHSKAVSYIPENEDAATSYGYKDLKIKNNTGVNITFESIADKDSVTVKVISG